MEDLEMAASSKVFTHYNCQHVFPGSVTARGLVTDGPFPADAADVTSQPPKQFEMRANGDRIVIWVTNAWLTAAFAAWV